jgi:hypothetical protein
MAESHKHQENTAELHHFPRNKDWIRCADKIKYLFLQYG